MSEVENRGYQYANLFREISKDIPYHMLDDIEYMETRMWEEEQNDRLER